MAVSERQGADLGGATPHHSATATGGSMYAPGHAPSPPPPPDAGVPDFASPSDLAFRQGVSLQLAPGGKPGAAGEPPATPTFSFAPSVRSTAPPPFDFAPARSLGAPAFSDALPGGRPPRPPPPPTSPFDLALGPGGA